jgi:hypothetical protein
MSRTTVLGALLVAACMATGCKLDLNDPNFPTEEVVFSDGENILLLAIGIQAEAAALIGPQIFVTSLTTDETGAGAATFANFMTADIGGQLEAGQYLSENPWAGAYRVKKLSDDLLGAVPNANLRAGTKSGILALAKLFRAMAYGQLATLYQQAPLAAGIDNPNAAFVPRAALLTEAISLLNSARADIQATPVSDEFNTRVLAPGFNLSATIDAMLARYSLMAGDYANAATAAARVTARSEFRFSPTVANPVFSTMYNSGNAFQLRARQDFRMNAEAGDQRVAYWVAAASIAGANRTLDDLNKYRSADTPFPVFLPDEMTLIRAEVAARNNDLDNARTLINQVRTQCDVTTEPAPCLPALSATDLPSQAAVLTEILRQRRYELYLQGLRLDDLRRFNATRKYDFLPLPQTECDRNSAAPC